MIEKLPNMIPISEDGMNSEIQLITMMAMYNQKCHKKSLLRQFCKLAVKVYSGENNGKTLADSAIINAKVQVYGDVKIEGSKLK